MAYISLLQHDLAFFNFNCFSCIFVFFAFLFSFSYHFRQEFLGMQTKYAALESRCAGDLLRQDHAVCGATGALSDLGQRLNELVKQIIASYNISEQDIEVRCRILISQNKNNSSNFLPFGFVINF